MRLLMNRWLGSSIHLFSVPNPGPHVDQFLSNIAMVTCKQYDTIQNRVYELRCALIHQYLATMAELNQIWVVDDDSSFTPTSSKYAACVP